MMRGGAGSVQPESHTGPSITLSRPSEGPLQVELSPRLRKCVLNFSSAPVSPLIRPCISESVISVKKKVLGKATMCKPAVTWRRPAGRRVRAVPCWELALNTGPKTFKLLCQDIILHRCQCVKDPETTNLTFSDTENNWLCTF